MSDGWFALQKGKRYGPYSKTRLRDLAQRGKLKPTDLISQADGQWIAAVELGDLFVTSADSQPSRRSSSSSSRDPRPLPPALLPAPFLPPEIPPASPPAQIAATASLPTAAAISGYESYAQPSPGIATAAYLTPSPAYLTPSPSHLAPPPASAVGAAPSDAPISRGRFFRRRSSSLLNIIATGSALLVGAAAAVVIYINIEGLENRIFRRNRPDDAATQTPPTPAASTMTSPSTSLPTK